MNTHDQRKLRSKAVNLKPVVWIGKNGLNLDVFDEIHRQLDKKELVKIKFTKSFISEKDKKQVAEEIISKTNSELICFVGFTITLYKSKGCDKCNDIGYKGRVGIYEILTMSPEIEKLILGGAVSEYDMQKVAEEQGMVNMLQDGLIKALKGMTSIKEILAKIKN